VDVEVGEMPDPFTLRSAIAARLSGRSWPTETEDAIARAVSKAVRDAAENRSADRTGHSWH
jgi:hypothetical protein